VVVPSLTLDRGDLARMKGSTFHEERLLFLLIRLRNPYARLVYVTSQPIHPMILEYYLQFLTGIPASHARARLTLLCAHDSSARALTLKILERPRLVQRIRAAIPNPENAYLTVFNSTPLERRLAVLLGIPSNGVDPDLAWLGTKSGSRRVFHEAGVPCPEGFEDLRSRSEVEEALLDLRRRRPGLRGAVLKLNQSFGGEGNAVFRYPTGGSRTAISRALRQPQFSVATENPDSYFEKYGRGGGVVEELLEGPVCRSPSAQIRVNPLGDTTVSSTHEQILGGPTGQVYLGCRFPAGDAYRLALQETGLRIGSVLAKKGVMSRFSVDFLARREGSSSWSLHALEINLRMGGTTHPMLALRFLTGGGLDPATGLFRTPNGLAKYYRATDSQQSEAYRTLLPEDLVEILTVTRLGFDLGRETGVLFHSIGAVSEFGNVGMLAIGNSPEEAEMIFERTVEALALETRYGRAPSSTPGETLRPEGADSLSLASPAKAIDRTDPASRGIRLAKAKAVVLEKGAS
jgi:hypothetical protein